MVPLLLLLLLQFPQPPTRWPIESLAVENPGEYSEAEILSYAGLKLGLVAGKEELEAARRRLMESGFFGGAGYRFKPSASGKGIAVTLELAEAGEVYPIRFERLEVPNEELTATLKASDPLYRDRVPATPVILARYARTIEAFLAARNRKVEVAGKLWPDRSNNLAVLFSPAARAPAIAQVQFAGNSVIPAEALQTAIDGVAIGAAYTESDFRELLDSSVRRLYDARGRIRVEFPKLTVSPAEGVDGVAVTVEVVEGEAYTVGGVRLAGDALPEEELLKAADFKTGDVANFSEIDAGVGRIRQQLSRSGYLKPETSVERVLHDAERKVDVVVHVTTGPRFLFGKLVIQGLDLDGEAQVRRLWALKPGAPFDSDYPDFFLARIREDGVFDHLGKTKAEVKIDDASRTVDVTLRFARN